VSGHSGPGLILPSDLPEAPAPAGLYERGVVHGGIGFLSGQFPFVGGKLAYTGRIGAELTDAEGREACRIAAINAVAAMRVVLGGDLGRLATVLRVDGHLASADGWTGQPAVLDAASEVFLRLLGNRGRHARTAFAPAWLPLDAPVELVVTFAVHPSSGP